MSSEIIITSPNSAKEGATVQFSIAIRNTWSTPQVFHMECWAPDQSFKNELFDVVDSIDAGATKAWPPATFKMPDYDAEIFVWLERWSGSDYIYENASLKKVSLSAELVPEFANFGVTEYSRA